MTDATWQSPLGGPDGPSPLGDPPPTPFACFGLEPAFRVDAEELRKRLVRLSRWLHPDFYGGSDQADERALAERNSAELNAAFDVLTSDAARADWLVAHLGGPDQDAERQMPQAFLMEVLEWNEALDEARESAPGSPERAALEQLATTLDGERAGAFDAIAGLLDPLPDPGAPALTEVRRLLNAVRYVDRALDTIRELRLAQAASG